MWGGCSGVSLIQSLRHACGADFVHSRSAPSNAGNAMRCLDMKCKTKEEAWNGKYEVYFMEQTNNAHVVKIFVYTDMSPDRHWLVFSSPGSPFPTLQ